MMRDSVACLRGSTYLRKEKIKVQWIGHQRCREERCDFWCCREVRPLT